MVNLVYSISVSVHASLDEVQFGDLFLSVSLLVTTSTVRQSAIFSNLKDVMEIAELKKEIKYIRK